MSFQRLAAAAAFTMALLANADAFAEAVPPQLIAGCSSVDTLQALFASELADRLAAGEALPANLEKPASAMAVPTDPRQLLAEFAMTLRDIRYRRGGRVPATGFDCSGFVHYVFAQAMGVDLPDDSASQFRAGAKIARADMQTGDLVFFHIRGKRISHVGIYLDHDRFIHSPTTGERVRVDRLDDSYWAKRFAGAKRPQGLT